jgi:hypothetical protein
MRLLIRLTRAVLLGVGTLFGLKGEGDAHWSDPPDHVLSIESVSEDDDLGEPKR